MIGRWLLALAVLIMLSDTSLARIYIVKRGDSLYKIAKRFKVSIRKLKRLNHLRSSRIYPGQRLIIPEKKPPKPVKSERTIKYIFKNAVEEKPSNSFFSIVEEESEFIAELLSQPRGIEVPNWSLSILEVPKYKSAFLKYLVEILKEVKNTPYVFGGENPKKGLDCSSFTRFVYRKFGINLPRTARLQFNFGVPVSKKELKIGDLVFFRTYASFPSHVGIYVGDGKFVHFSRVYHGLAISSLNDRYFKRRFIGARRVLNEWVVKKVAYKRGGEG